MGILIFLPRWTINIQKIKKQTLLVFKRRVIVKLVAYLQCTCFKWYGKYFFLINDVFSYLLFYPWKDVAFRRRIFSCNILLANTTVDMQTTKHLLKMHTHNECYLWLYDSCNGFFLCSLTDKSTANKTYP